MSLRPVRSSVAVQGVHFGMHFLTVQLKSASQAERWNIVDLPAACVFLDTLELVPSAALKADVRVSLKRDIKSPIG